MVPPPPPPPPQSIPASIPSSPQQQQQLPILLQIDDDQHKWMGIPFFFNEEQPIDIPHNTREAFIDLLDDFFNSPIKSVPPANSQIKPTNMLELPTQISIPSLGTWMYKFPRRNIHKILPLPYLPMDQSKKKFFWYDIWKGVLMWSDDSNVDDNHSKKTTNIDIRAKKVTNIRQSTKVVAFTIERKSITPPLPPIYQDSIMESSSLSSITSSSNTTTSSSLNHHRKEVFVNMILIRTESYNSKDHHHHHTSSQPPPQPPPPLLIVPPNIHVCEAWFQALSLGVRLNKEAKTTKIRICLEK